MASTRISADFDAHEARKLALDIQAGGERAQLRCRRVVKGDANELKQLWRKNARKTAARHGKRYPRAIGYDIEGGGFRAVIGPDALMPQAGMSFEYGSRNQKPHLDGNRAADVVFPQFRKNIADAAELDL